MARKGKCRICGKRRDLDPHHIISQGRAKKLGRSDLISNQGNIVHICRGCHKETTSYLVRGYFERKEKKGEKTPFSWVKKPVRKAKKKAKRTRCSAMTKGETSIHIGHRCRIKALPGEDYCHIHNRKR